MRLTQNDVVELMLRQEQLNSCFTVSRWDDSLVSTAFLVEYAEMMCELQPIWKVWKESGMFIKAAKVEFIDCVHFALSILLIRAEDDQQGFISTFDTTKRVMNIDGDFLTKVNSDVSSLIAYKSSYPLTLLSFVDFVDDVTEFLEISEEEFYELYAKKTEINKKRISEGYSVGKYKDKDTELDQF